MDHLQQRQTTAIPNMRLLALFFVRLFLREPLVASANRAL